jgi:hypothetical protein
MSVFLLQRTLVLVPKHEDPAPENSDVGAGGRAVLQPRFMAFRTVSFVDPDATSHIFPFYTCAAYSFGKEKYAMNKGLSTVDLPPGTEGFLIAPNLSPKCHKSRLVITLQTIGRLTEARQLHTGQETGRGTY